MAEDNKPQDRQALIESRINTEVAGALPMSELGIVFRAMGEVMEFAKMMAVSGPAVPPVFRNNPGACLAVAIKAHHLGFEPFSFAQKCYFVNDNLAYEAQLINAIIIRRGGYVKRPSLSYAGEGQSRTCTVVLHFPEPDGDKEYTSPKISDIKPQNSPLWKSDPDQQLGYYSVRAAARRHSPDVILGMYDQEEMAALAAKDITPIGRPATEDISARLAAGKKPDITYTGGDKEAAQPVVADVPGEKAPENAPQTAADSQPVNDTAQTESASPAPALAPADPAPSDMFEGAMILELRTALPEAKSQAELKVLVDEFQGNIDTASADTAETMMAMISIRASELP